nr:hypothetical protein [uncultured Actinomyces sp.]
MNSSYALPNFSSDYQEGAHARVLDALVATNMEQASGYGTDEHCERARDLIRGACAVPDADVYFLVGGTKCGALFGEAVVIPERGSIRQFVTQMKQHGALLAKGRLLGVQFEALFEDDLYVRIGAPAVEASAKSPPWTRCPARARGDGERARRAAHIQDLLARFEREQIEEPSLVVAGRVSRERRGPLVPIGLRVSVDCAVVCRHGLVLRCAYC